MKQIALLLFLVLVASAKVYQSEPEELLDCAFDATDPVFQVEVHIEPAPESSEEEESHEELIELVETHQATEDVESEESEETPEEDLPLEHEYNEYGYGLWTKWSRTSPKYLAEKSQWHSIIRLTTNENHSNERNPGDRTLVIWLGRGFYHFSTYHNTTANLFENVEYGDYLEGQWNFLYFGYRKQRNTGMVKGYVWLNQSEWRTVSMVATHTPINSYAHLLVKKEFGHPLFNGKMAKIYFKLGEGAFKDSQIEVEALATRKLQLPALWLGEPEHTSQFLLEEEREVTNEAAFEPFTYTEELKDVSQYSVSGWVRQVESTRANQLQSIVRLTIHEEPRNNQQAGDRTLYIQKGNQNNYVFSTYTCDQENNCSFLQEDSNYDDSEKNVWTFLYFGYDSKLRRAFGYTLYATHDNSVNMADVKHFIPTTFHVHLQKDPFLPGFTGFMRAWVLNIGEGSFKTSQFKEENLIPFGYILGVSQATLLPGWQPEDQTEIHEQAYNNLTPSYEVEITETEEAKLNGILEYGYGFWSRFLFNGPEKLVSKPSTMGLSRMSTNSNYRTDVRNAGDRTLAIFITNGNYQFATYSLLDQGDDNSRNNLLQNLPYGQSLDGVWNYIFFGYKRYTTDNGRAKGFVAINGERVLATEYPPMIIHKPLTNFIYFAVGSSGTQVRYPSFNGQLTRVTLLLGQDSFIDSENQLLTLIDGEQPQLTHEAFHKKVIEEQYNNESEDGHDVEVLEEMNGVEEYSVELWFRYVPEQIRNAPVEVIYTLTQNEQPNNRNPGDRLLSLHRRGDGTLVFSSYDTPDISDNYQPVSVECRVEDPFDQTGWSYAYFGYRRGHLQYFLKTLNTRCDGQIAAIHRVSKYVALYPGKDALFKKFHGKLAYLQVNSGEGAYRTDGFQNSETYADGLDLFPTAFEWDEQADEIAKVSYTESAFTQEFQDTEEINMDGQQIYGYGFWSKFLMTYPTRLKQKPQWISTARLTGLTEHQDQQAIFDRVLALFIGRGMYQFSTYNLQGNRMSQNVNVEYGNSLEGVWNFIYVSYSNPAQAVKAFVYFSDRNEVQSQEILQVDHRPLPGYAKFILGAEFDYVGFNGLVSGLVVRFDRGAYLNSVEQFRSLYRQDYTLPLDTEHDVVHKLLVEQQSEEAHTENLEEEFNQVDEYSIYGWFKLNSDAVFDQQRPIQVIMKLTNNNEELRQENVNLLGDKALAIYLSQIDYQFTTYSIGQLDNGSNPNLRENVPFGDQLGVWTYFYMSYSRRAAEVHYYVQFPHGQAQNKFNNVKHFVPGHLEFLIGDDQSTHAFQGHFARVGVSLGHGAFQTTEGNQQDLPQLDEFDSHVSYQHRAPVSERQVDLTFELELEQDQISGATEYGWGVWTRWLTVYPEWLQQKEAWHTIMKFSSTKTNENMARYGNRLLNAYVGRGFYQFATSDKSTQNNNVVQNVDYGDDLEGHWNYLYFSFKKREESSNAIAYVYFSVKDIYQEARFDVTHTPLLEILKIKVAPREFSYQPFHGQMFDLQIFVGDGYIQSQSQLHQFLQGSPVPEDPSDVRTTVNVMSEVTQVTIESEVNPHHVEDKLFVNEYGVSGWFKFDRLPGEQQRVIFRLTTNNPEVMRDSSSPGDRTLVFLANEQSFGFSTYNFLNVDRFDETRDTIQQSRSYDLSAFRGVWNYVYFGYSFELEIAYATVISTSGVSVELELTGINHLLPKDFYLYLGVDDLLPNFEGSLSHFDLQFGDGAFTRTPKQFITTSPENVIVLQRSEEEQHKLSKNKKLRKQKH